MNDSNPYTAPQSNVDNKLISKSSIPKVIGIISIILGVIGIFGAIANIAMSFLMPAIQEAQINMGYSKNYLLGMSAVSLLTSIWAIFIGYKLIKYKDIGRRHFNYYTAFAVVLSIVNYFMTKDMMTKLYADMDAKMADAAMDMSTIGSLSVFIMPILVIVVALLLNQQRVKDCLN